MAFQGSKINPSRHDKSQLPFYLILIPFALFALFPVLFIVFHAFKPMDELFAFPPKFLPENPTLDNFRMLFETGAKSTVQLSRYLFNSIIVTVIVMIFSVLFSSMAGYILSKYKFTGKNFIFNLNQLALMFIGTAVAIPRYLVVSKAGIVDSFWAHILPLIAIPVGLFLLKQFIDGIPDEVIEAAKMDGASSLEIYFKIIIPLIKPALATVAILSFQTVWNSTEASMFFINDENLKTFAYYMTTLSSTAGGTNIVSGQGMAAAASLIMFIPNLVIFIIFQNKVMNTISHSGLK
ncbi:MAG: carbohydrate ABC transporter permease [Mycoplasmatales bacterium]